MQLALKFSRHRLNSSRKQLHVLPISKINWASHMVLMDSKLSLGSRYWYMKQSNRMYIFKGGHKARPYTIRHYYLCKIEY